MGRYETLWSTLKNKSKDIRLNESKSDEIECNDNKRLMKDLKKKSDVHEENLSEGLNIQDVIDKYEDAAEFSGNDDELQAEYKQVAKWLKELQKIKGESKNEESLNEMISDTELHGKREVFDISSEDAKKKFIESAKNLGIDVLYDAGDKTIQVIYPTESDIKNKFYSVIKDIAEKQ